MANGMRTLEVDGVALDLKVVRKRVKNINARLHGKTLSVSAPHRVSVRELDETIVELARTLVRRSRADALNSDGGAEVIARKVAARFPKPPEVAEVRFVTNQTSQWGSYSRQTGIIRLNATLRQMPPLGARGSGCARAGAHLLPRSLAGLLGTGAIGVFKDRPRARVPRGCHLVGRRVG